METKIIKKSINLQAPKEKVWDVLINDKFTRIWYAEFSEGSHADTDWKVGSKVTFTDHSMSGIVGRVIANNPYEIISVEYEGLVKDGVEDYESKAAKNMKGGRETYRLSEMDGVTHLLVEGEGDMPSDFFESMSGLWDKALMKIKELSEGLQGASQPLIMTN